MDVLLRVSRQFREAHAKYMDAVKKIETSIESRNDEERRRLYETAQDRSVLLRLRELSSDELKAQLARQEENLHDSLSEIRMEMEALRLEVEELLEQMELQSSGKLPWKIRYCLELDPEDVGGAGLQLGGGLITDERGHSVWHDYCIRCNARIENAYPRYRSLESGHVECEACHELCVRLNITPLPEPVLLEKEHTVIMRLRIPVHKQLSAALRAVFVNAYPHRPCFSSVSSGVVLSYAQVYSEAMRIGSFIRQTTSESLSPRVGILLSGVEYHLVDLACIFAGRTSVALSPQYHADSIPTILSEKCGLAFCYAKDLHLLPKGEKIGKVVVFEENFNTISGTVALDEADDGTLERDHVAPCTIFYSSGSSGSPKGVLVSRHSFLLDLQVPTTPSLLVHASFLPVCWGASRLGVYQTCFNGGQVVFCDASPLNLLFQQLSRVRPTYFFAPPAVFEAMSTNRTDDEIRTILGERIQSLGSGGAKISSHLATRFERIFGCQFLVGYGISEVGGVASNGVILKGVQVRIQNGALDQEGFTVGEVQVRSNLMMLGYDNVNMNGSSVTADGYFVTGDIGRMKGSKLEILGRANLSAVKLQNGTWFSCEAAEQEAMASIPGIESVMVHVHQEGDDAVDVIVAIVHMQAGFEQNSSDWYPLVHAVIFSAKPLARTVSLKLNRRQIVEEFREQLATVLLKPEPASEAPSSLEAVRLACQLLQCRQVDPSKSILQNGASSIIAAKFASHFPGLSGAVFSPIQELDSYLLSNSMRKLVPPVSNEEFQRMMQQDYDDPVVSESTIMPEGNAILVTGATGFVGRHLVRDLVQRGHRVIAMVRQQKSQLFDANVEMLHGADFSLDNFGLSKEQYDSLQKRVSFVIHCGAWVDFRSDYNQCRLANVIGTRNMVKFCLPGRSMMFVSSMSAGGKIQFTEGYAASKYVAEHVVRKNLGTLGQIVRLPFVAFDRRTGESNRADWLTLMVRSCIQIQWFPNDFHVQIECVPLDSINTDKLGFQQHYMWSLDVLLEEIRTQMFPAFRTLRMIDWLLLIQEQEAPALSVAPILRGMLQGQGTAPSSLPQLRLSSEELRRFVGQTI